MTEHRVASLGDVPEGTGVAVDIGNKRIAIFRYRGEIYALDETCPHRGAPLHQGTVQNGIVLCPWHQWQFALDSGCSPVNPNSRVQRYPVRVEDGAVWVSL